MKLYIVGLGQKKGELSVRASEIIKESSCVIARTMATPTAENFAGRSVVSLDHIYKEADDFEQLGAKLKDEVLRLAKQNKETVYCVNGSAYNDLSVKLIKAEFNKAVIIPAATSGVRCEFPIENCQEISAYSIREKGIINAGIPLYITEIDNRLLASDIKLNLLKLFDEDSAVLLFIKNKIQTLILEDLDRVSGFDYSTEALVIPKKLTEKKQFNMSDLIAIMDVLLSENGCPWDKAQTNESIRINMLEEAYEAVDAVMSGQPEKMIEEFGDVLLQAVFNSILAEKKGEFDFSDVVSALCTKLIYRHTHIFGKEEKAEDSVTALKNWEKAKQREKKFESVSEDIENLPSVFPANIKTYKTIKKAVKAGLKDSDEKSAAELFEEEYKVFIKDGKNEKSFMLSLVNLLRCKDIEPEMTMIEAQKFFKENFKNAEQNKAVSRTSLTEMIKTIK